MKREKRRFMDRPTTGTVVVSPRITLDRRKDDALIDFLSAAPAGKLAQVLRELLRLGMLHKDESSALLEGALHFRDEFPRLDVTRKGDAR